MLEKVVTGKLDVVAQSKEQFCVDFDEAWGWIGYARKDHGKRTLESNFKEGVDFKLLNSGELKGDKKIKTSAIMWPEATLLKGSA